MKNLFFGAILSIASLTVFADFNQAVKNYEAGDYKKAFLEFQYLAEIGNKNAQYNLGFMYLDGLGVKQDLYKAYAWIKLSNEKSNSQETTTVLSDIRKHIKNQSALNTQVDEISRKFSQNSIVSELKPVFTTDVSYKFAKPIHTTLPSYPLRADFSNIEGYARAEFKLDENGRATHIEIVDSVPYGMFDNTTVQAIKDWFFDVSDADLNYVYSYKITFKKSGKSYSNKTRNKIKKYKALSSKGDPVGQFYYAKYGSIVLNDDVDETTLLYKSAAQGLTDSQHELGLRLLRGDGCFKDIEKGLKWLTKAAASNFGRSQLRLSKYYSQLDSDEAFFKSQFWFDKAISSNDKGSALEIASLISNNSKYNPADVIQKLKLLSHKDVNDPAKFYMLYAAAYANLKDYNSAVKYQNKANNYIKKYSRVPTEMKKLLSGYKSKLVSLN